MSNSEILLPVTIELKEKFKKFCADEFKGREVCINLWDDKEDWFYVYAGKKYSWQVHYEYCKGKVHLHSEFENDELEKLFENFMNTRIDKEFKYVKNPAQGIKAQWTYQKDISKDIDLWRAFIYVKNFFDPLITMFENRNSFLLPVNLILSKTKSLKYFLCHIDKDSTVFSCPKTEIEKKAFRNDKTLNVFYKNIADGIGEIKFCESAFENCRELKAVVFGNKDYSDDKDLDIKEVVSTGSTTESDASTSAIADSLAIQYRAFKDCENLHTVVLPKFNSLIIEKDSFVNCKNLRTIVLLENDETSSVSISEEAFSNCNDITFICKKDGKVARFARENNFKVVVIDE